MTEPTPHRRLVSLLALLCLAGPARPGAPEPAVRPPATTLRTPATAQLRVDAAGFIRRWLVLDPVAVSGRLTMDEIEKGIADRPFPGGSALPQPGEPAPWAGEGLRWHALDTQKYNVNLYHFAWANSRPTSNVLFWAITVVDVPADMPDVRLAIGSNAASVWWLNDERVIALYNDRQSVIDDGVSRRVTLRKGRNAIRAAIENGGGATDFCARFLDGQDRPLTGLSIRIPARSPS